MRNKKANNVDIITRGITNLNISTGNSFWSLILNTPDNHELFKNIVKFLLMPKQLAVLKQVCKYWKDIVESIPYLRLDGNLQKSPNKTAMALAPVNSSGDIYQLLAFTILSIHDGKQVPPILLLYDTDDVKKQVNRSYNFASLLGYKDCFYQVKTETNNSSQPVVRQNQLIQKLEDNNATHYIDNRLSTSIISDSIREKGFDKTTATIRYGLSKWDISLLGNNNNKDIELQITKIKKLYEKTDKPTVVIHYRYAKTANAAQNMNDLMPSIISYLKEDYNLVCIYAGEAKYFKGIDINIEPFKNAKNHNNKDISKLYHLKLLLRLFDEKDNINLAGIIGNTSGTLDLAALIGHNVFNIHKFSTPITYQDYRIMLQTTFLKVEKGNGALSNEDSEVNFYSNLLCWVDLNYKPTFINNLIPPSRASFRGMAKTGFFSLSSVMHVTEGKWQEQSFFNNLKSYVDDIFTEIGFFKSPYTPPIDVKASLYER